MIQRFVDKFMAERETLLAQYRDKRPEDYEDLFRDVVRILSGDVGNVPDPKRIHVIDEGDYQGTQVFIVGCTGYQPSTYWACLVAYGSCSGCDTFEDNRGWGDEITEKEALGNWTMALHMVQGLRCLSGEE